MAVSSLGIGSGVLTSDLIDKLRAADDASVLTPFTKKITLANQKGDAYTLLSSLMSTFKSSTVALSGSNLYQDRSIAGNTDAVTVTAKAGSDVQTFNITNVSKAEKDVWNSKNSFSSAAAAIPGLGTGTLSVTIGGTPLAIDYTPETTLNDIKTAINENAGATMTASTLQIGDSSYSLAISADALNQAIIFSDSNTSNQTNNEHHDEHNNTSGMSLLSALNLNNIQPAKEATFNYNGISIARSTNDISDLINGVTITLNQNQAATDTATINISQNVTSINSEMSKFIENYNLLTSNIRETTSSDTTAGSPGVFSTESFVKSISRNLTEMITQVDSHGNSLINYGISIDRNGTMSLDSSIFKAKLNEDPAAMELFFSGNSSTDGIFTKLKDQMDGYIGYNGQLSNFSDQLSTSKTSLTSQYDKQKATLDARYAVLTKRFTAYDALISRLNTQFSSLQQLINAGNKTGK